MEFCDVCGQLMQPKNENGKLFLICPNGHTKPLNPEDVDDFVIESTVTHSVTEEMIVDDGKTIFSHPVTQRYCKVCKKTTPTEYWDKQTRSADEAPTRFYRCTICGNTEREYD